MEEKLYNSASVRALALAAGLAIATPAAAADLGGAPTYKPALMPAPAISWNGFYGGVHAGGGELDLDGVYENGDSAVDPSFLDLSGVLGGGHLGWNWDRGGGLVLGIEADISLMDWENREPSIDSSDEIIADVDYLASIRGRLGFVTGERRQALLYATAGIAFPDVSVEVWGSTRPNTDNVLRADLDDIGGVFGLGFEYAMTENFRFGVEGLYYYLDDDLDIARVGTFTSGQAGNNVGLDDAYVVRARMSWYFNGGR